MQIGKNQTLVLGPPGCGKTTDLLNKVEALIAEGISPARIGFVSFTRKAITEATSRACNKFGLRYDEFPYFKTIHSLCFFLLGVKRSDIVSKEHMAELGAILGYRFGGSFDESETGMPVGSDKGDMLLFMDNFARVTMKSLREAWQIASNDIDWFEQERMSNTYAKYKDNGGLLDFTDLLSLTITKKLTVDLDVVFIDEAQDLSRLQWAVLHSLFQNVNRVFIAGDDDQSIYKWSGADVDTFLTLPGKKELLTQSYRVPRLIHRVSTKIITSVKNRYDKPYHPKDEEGVMDVCQNLDYVKWHEDGSTLLLARNVYLLARYTKYLRLHGIPYVMRGGHSSVKTAHIEAIMAWEALRKGESITGRAAKRMYDQLKIGKWLRRGGRASIGRMHDDDAFAIEHLINDHGLVSVDAIWHDALEGIDQETREFYLAILRSKRKLTAPPTVSINTIHGVKGGEADHVVVVSDMSWRTYQEYQKGPDNEHRVAYVAVTRAKKRLTIVQASTNLAYPY